MPGPGRVGTSFLGGLWNSKDVIIVVLKVTDNAMVFPLTWVFQLIAPSQHFTSWLRNEGKSCNFQRIRELYVGRLASLSCFLVIGLSLLLTTLSCFSGAWA